MNNLHHLLQEYINKMNEFYSSTKFIKNEPSNSKKIYFDIEKLNIEDMLYVLVPTFSNIPFINRLPINPIILPESFKKSKQYEIKDCCPLRYNKLKGDEIDNKLLIIKGVGDTPNKVYKLNLLLGKSVPNVYYYRAPNEENMVCVFTSKLATLISNKYFATEHLFEDNSAISKGFQENTIENILQNSVLNKVINLRMMNQLDKDLYSKEFVSSISNYIKKIIDEYNKQNWQYDDIPDGFGIIDEIANFIGENDLNTHNVILSSNNINNMYPIKIDYDGCYVITWSISVHNNLYKRLGYIEPGKALFYVYEDLDTNSFYSVISGFSSKAPLHNFKKYILERIIARIKISLISSELLNTLCYKHLSNDLITKYNRLIFSKIELIKNALSSSRYGVKSTYYIELHNTNENFTENLLNYLTDELIQYAMYHFDNIPLDKTQFPTIKTNYDLLESIKKSLFLRKKEIAEHINTLVKP